MTTTIKTALSDLYNITFDDGKQLTSNENVDVSDIDWLIN